MDLDHRKYFLHWTLILTLTGIILFIIYCFIWLGIYALFEQEVSITSFLAQAPDIVLGLSVYGGFSFNLLRNIRRKDRFTGPEDIMKEERKLKEWLSTQKYEAKDGIHYKRLYPKGDNETYYVYKIKRTPKKMIVYRYIVTKRETTFAVLPSTVMCAPDTYMNKKKFSTNYSIRAEIVGLSREFEKFQGSN